MQMPVITEAEQIRVNLTLSGMVKGKSKTVPHIKIDKDKVPTGTKHLYLVLEDLDFHNLLHGAELLPYQGSDIELKDEFKLLIPLSPPDGSHHYQLTVRALD